MDFAKKKPKIAKKDSKFAALIFKIGVFLAVILVVFSFLITRPIEGRYNLLVVSDDLLLISLEKNQSQVAVVLIPRNTMLTATYNKGSVLAGSLYKLDNVSKQHGKLLTSTIREFLGIPVGDWMLVEDTDISAKDSFFQALNSNLNFKSNITPRYKSSLSLISAPRFFYNLSSIRPDRIKFIDLKDNNSLLLTTFADGSKALTIDSIDLDSYLNGVFNQWIIRKEGLTISVLNGADVAGLATRASRIVSNSGGNVIQLLESPTKVVDCIIHTSSKFENSYTVRKLREIFKCDITNKIIEESRADVGLVVGNAYSKQVTVR